MRPLHGPFHLLLLLLSLAAAPDARILEHKGRWESGYGAKFYNVVGRLQNTSGHALRWVKPSVKILAIRRMVSMC